jgi:uncharacterized protein with HEPN domain
MSKAGKLRVPEYLEHILEAIRRIHIYVEDMSDVKFLEDVKTQDAVIRNFEIIGEACRNIDFHQEVGHGLPRRNRLAGRPECRGPNGLADK